MEDLQSLVLTGKFGNQPGQLKPLHNLLVEQLREELNARGFDTTGKLKRALQNELIMELKEAQRVPTLNPPQTLQSLNLQEYEIFDCEPLHDSKAHAFTPDSKSVIGPRESSDINWACALRLFTQAPNSNIWSLVQVIMPNPYLTDLRWCIVWMNLVHRASTRKISWLLCLSKRTVQRYLALFHRTGDVKPRARRNGPPKLLGDLEQVIILRLII